MRGPPVDLSNELAVSLGMAVHKLATNAAKFGARLLEIVLPGQIRARTHIDYAPDGCASIAACRCLDGAKPRRARMRELPDCETRDRRFFRAAPCNRQRPINPLDRDFIYHA